MEAGAILETDLLEPLDVPDSFQDRASLERAQERDSYRCVQCGHPLRVFGGGRHRVYFEPDNPGLDDPIMTGVCPQCGHRLPGKQ
jgi:DNA-directed RNA polymerase subunit RPC12/RpoP